MRQTITTATNYDILLKTFVSGDDLRPAMMQPNTVRDKTYSTDAHSLIIIPNELLICQYPAHAKTPNFQYIIDQIKEIDPIVFKDTDLFKAMKKMIKVPDVGICQKCDGEGECSHCGAMCEECEGEGYIEDSTLPKVYTDTKSAIKINNKLFSPRQIQKLEQTILEMMEDTFSVVGENNSVIMIKIKEVQIIIAALNADTVNLEEKNIIKLNPI